MIKWAGLVLSAGVAVAVPALAQTARVAQGQLQGVEKEGVDAYLGVPYAAAPMGDRRWARPFPAAAWTGVRQATEFGASCAQAATGAFGPFTHEYTDVGKISEDCLFLNVWSPAAKSANPRPVLVWIHGGAFLGGSGSVPVYDGAALAKRGIIVVTINYRLGVFGFLAHPDLTREQGSSGNYGLMDMVAALQWVHANIAAFGGDPARVTIAGQSAGSAGVHDMVASPLAKGLFRGAIAQSGSGLGSPMGMGALHSSEDNGARFAASVGATSITDLRKVPMETLFAAAGSNPMQAKFRFGPIVDGYVLPKDPATQMAGEFADVPVMTGMNADEGSSRGPGYGKASVAEVQAAVRRRFGTLAEKALPLYATADDAEAGRQSLALGRDGGLANTFLWADQRAGRAKSPAYVYYFRQTEPGPNSAAYGAFHTAEVPYMFQNFAKSPERPFTAQDRVVSDTMARYWVNFVATGNPNGAGLAKWPAFSGDKPMAMEFGSSTGARDVLPIEKYAIYRALVAGGGGLSLF